MRKLPARYAPLVAPMLLSLLMTFVVSGIATWRGIGLPANFVSVGWGAWGLSWVVAFPTLLAVQPVVRRLTAAIVETHPGAATGSAPASPRARS